jgi:molecular chaperone Hsp33
VTALLREHGLRVALVNAGEVAREGRRVQKAEGAAASLFGIGLAGGLLMGALLKGRSRIHLQLECDGPLRGLFVEANAEGEVRGYVKNPRFGLEGDSGAFRWRPALGNGGFLSVLRDLGGGEYYRSSVELEHFELARDLERYYQTSEQLETLIRLETVSEPQEPLRSVVGLLVQPLPGGDRAFLKELDGRMREQRLQALLARDPPTSAALLKALFPGPDLEVMSRFPIRYVCGCSLDRVKRALLAMGRQELQTMLAEEGKAEVTCEFCGTHYRVSGTEIQALLQPS